MSRRASQPLNSSAVQAADEELYTAHENDPRPNALFDENGNRKPLSATDPSQADLRSEWMDAYAANGGEIEGQEPDPGQPDPPPPEQDDPADDEEECIEPPADLIVYVEWTPRAAPVEKAIVTIDGPTTAQAQVNNDGIAEFRGIPPGAYSVEARLDSGYPMADAAHAHIGSGEWGYPNEKDPYPEDTNKCNLFVYDVANGAGYSVPKRYRWGGLKWNPPLAKHWATPSEDIGKWKPVNDPQPGDVVAEAIQYADASGHVGIIGYPHPNGLSTDVPPGSEKSVSVPLQRLTVSAAAYVVKHNEWGWRAKNKNPKFRRYSP